MKLYYLQKMGPKFYHYLQSTPGSKMSMFLKWDDFQSNTITFLKELFEDQDFVNVTLATEDGEVRAHKAVLSSGSPFFKNILLKHPHQDPLLYLMGVLLFLWWGGGKAENKRIDERKEEFTKAK